MRPFRVMRTIGKIENRTTIYGGICQKHRHQKLFDADVFSIQQFIKLFDCSELFILPSDAFQV